jgi:hypothetical protein
MNIVREYMPNGLPMLIQAAYRETPDGFLEIDFVSVCIHPVNGDGKVLPALLYNMDSDEIKYLACRLANQLVL